MMKSGAFWWLLHAGFVCFYYYVPSLSVDLSRQIILFSL